MKVIHVNTSDSHGGAARAAYRLHKGLRKTGLDSLMFVQEKHGEGQYVCGADTKIGKLFAQLRPYVDRIPAGIFRYDCGQAFSPSIVPGSVTGKINGLQPDIVHLHWLEKGFIRIEALGNLQNRPVVWTLHDSWAFTGGCHVPDTCTRYKECCGKCPILDSGMEHDLSRWVWKRKSKVLKTLDLTVVTPSKWLGDCARQSSLFANTRIEVIPNGIDIGIYKPLDQGLCREALSLPKNKKIIMFGAMYSTSDSNKGYDYLVAALRQIAGTSYQDEVVAVVIGATAPERGLDIGIDVRFLGHLNDDISLVVAYSAADVLVAPSIQENLPNMVLEAMACGVPCVAFDIGGMPDLIEHRSTGYLARPYEVDDLAEGLLWVIGDSELKHRLSVASREKIEEGFSDGCISQKYVSLYEDVLSRRKAVHS